MQERHVNRKLYFEEQEYTTEKYVIPYLKSLSTNPLQNTDVIGEIGCGEGGNLSPFLSQNYKVVGIDMDARRIKNAQEYFSNHPNIQNLQLICCDIYKVDASTIPQCDVLILRDVIEHIHHQDSFFEYVKRFMKPNARIFIAFPPWRMPFGGHQQICQNRFLSHLPFFHILPNFCYRSILKMGGETANLIDVLLEIKSTKLSINHYKNILKKTGFKIDKEDYYLINPNYEIKFHLKPKKVYDLFKIPYIADFYTTTHYSIISLKSDSN